MITKCIQTHRLTKNRHAYLEATQTGFSNVFAHILSSAMNTPAYWLGRGGVTKIKNLKNEHSNLKTVRLTDATR
jgi:hypothetical protein